MTDHSNGTYSYSFMALSEGYAIMSAYIEIARPVVADFWNNIYLSGTVDYSTTYTQLNENWGNGLVTDTQGDYVSGRFTFTIIPPNSDTYTIYLFHDNGARLWVDGTIKIDNWNDVYLEDDFTIAFNSGQKYNFIVEFFDNDGGASVQLSWAYTGQAKQIVPEDNFSSQQNIGASPLNVTVNSFVVPPEPNNSINQTVILEEDEEVVVNNDPY